MSAHQKALILREIADEAEVNPEPWKVFEYQLTSGGRWRKFENFADLMETLGEGWPTCRRSKTVKLRGEVSEEVVEKACKLVNKQEGIYSLAQYQVAEALLSLVDDNQ